MHLATALRKCRLSRLMLLGGVGLALSACGLGPPDDAVFFADQPACSARFGAEKCAEAHERATLSHLGYAPVSLLKEECENDFGEGNCEARYMPSRRPYYVPAMKGFMTSGGSFSEPVYADRDGSAIVPDGDSVYRVGRFTQGLITGVKVRSAKEAVPGKEARPNPRTSGILFQRETAQRISDHGFAGRPRRSALGSTASRRRGSKG